MNLETKTVRKLILIFLLLITLYLVLNYWSGIASVLHYVYKLLLPFILGGCIAFVLNIPMTFLQKKLLKVKGKKLSIWIHKWNTIISLVLSCFMIIGIIALVSYIVIPQIIETAKILPDTYNNSILALQKWVKNNESLSGNIISLLDNMKINWDSILNNAKSIVFDGASSMILSTIGAATTFANSIVNFVLGFIFAIYILLQKKSLGTQCKKILYAFLPIEKATSILDVLTLTSQTFSNFITGQCMEAVILGMMFFISMIIFRFPYAMVISVLIGCTSLIPILGSFIGCAVGIFLIVMINPIKAGLFIILFLVLQQIEGNIVYPRVVGNSVGLPSIWVLVAITLGGNMMGIMGMIIFIPLFSVAYVLFRKEVYRRLNIKNLKIE